MNKIKANIDNKNIMEWFTEDFHNGKCIEQTEAKITKQVFYLCECLCELSYRFGDNWFKFRIIEGEPNHVQTCSREASDIINSFNSENIQVKLNPYLGVYEFYFVES